MNKTSYLLQIFSSKCQQCYMANNSCDKYDGLIGRKWTRCTLIKKKWLTCPRDFWTEATWNEAMKIIAENKEV